MIDTQVKNGTDPLKKDQPVGESATIQEPQPPRCSNTLQAVIYNSESESFELNEQELKDFLFSPELENQKVAIVSIAGAFRKGKSFMLNFFIKYLEYLEKNCLCHGTVEDLLEKGQTIDNDNPSKLMNSENVVGPTESGTSGINSSFKHDSAKAKRVYSRDNDYSGTTTGDDDDLDGSDQQLTIPQWLMDSHERMSGFKWRGGSERETSGIVIWKKPYFLNTKRHGRVAVILMDTQGTFDWTSTVKNCATIFALSTMLSSVQLFNLSNNIQEDDLNHLQFFTEYGRLALQQSEFKPFQKLMFLVRDWPYRYEFDYGFSPEYLDKILQINENQPKELQNVRKHIHECFEDISCMLLPYPGSKVATSLKFKGRVRDIELPFLHHVGNLINHTISLYCRQAKEINGKALTGSDIFFYFKSYMMTFQCDDMPEPKNILMATGEADHLIAVKESQDYYMRKMGSMCGGDQPYMPPNQLNNFHVKIKQKSLAKFEHAKKMGSEIYHDKFYDPLEEFLEIRFKEFADANSAKNLLKNVRVFIICGFLFMVCLTISQILDFIGLDWFMAPFVLTARISLLLILFWFYLRITGHLRSSLVVMNEIAELIWQTLLELFMQFFTNSGFYPNTVSFLDTVVRASASPVPSPSKHQGPHK